MFPKVFFKHLAPALLAGLALRFFFIWRFPFYSGDTAYYEELARNWLYHGIYGFYSRGQLLPSDARGPGYPAFLAAIYFLAGTGRQAVMLAQAFVDLATCVVAAGIAARLATGALEAARSRVAIAAIWLTALCPFSANYAAVPLTEVLAVFFTTLALLIFLAPTGMEADCNTSNRNLLRGVKIWFAGGFLVGLGTLVRPETPLLLVAVLVAFLLRYRRPANWKKLTVATFWMIAGLLLPLAPWAGVSFHLEVVLAADRRDKSPAVRRGFSRGIFTRHFPARAVQPHARHDARSRSAVCGAGTRTIKASSDSHLCLDPHRALRFDVVYSANYPAAILRTLLAARGKLPLQPCRVRSHSRICAAQPSLRCTFSRRRVVFSHKSWSFSHRHIHSRPHSVPHTIANLRAPLRAGMLSRTAGRWHTTPLPRTAEEPNQGNS